MSIIKSSTKTESKNQEVPIFLRKTYHMIDTCDDNVCSWCEEGTTFIVKAPETFEKVIIPQFFKHSKFSSFVRQLNFYGFRKIKYTDSIRINTKEEEKTANFWRFRHENFRKGREDLLMDIKRMNSASKEGTKPNSTKTKLKKIKKEGEDVKELKEELNTLKDRIKEMTCNIDTLTSLVQTVTLKEQTVAPASAVTQAQGQGQGCVQERTQEQEHVDTMIQEEIGDQVDDSKPVGAKRKKISLDQGLGLNDTDMNMIVDQVMSSASPEPMNVASSTLALEDVTFTPTVIFPVEPVLSQEAEGPASEADEAFVDELFNAFDDEMDDLMVPLSGSDNGNVNDNTAVGNALPIFISPTVTPSKQGDVSATITSTSTMARASASTRTNTATIAMAASANTPDQEMMNKLSEALTVLPKDVQEMLVNRLIITITSTDSLKGHIDSVCAEKKEKTLFVPVSTVQAAEAATKLIKTDGWEHNSDVVLQTASATLTALMTQFSKNLEKKKAVVNTETLSVISIHA